MISFENARKRCLAIKVPSRKIDLDIELALGHFLADFIYAPQPQPLCDNSAMDGYAVRFADISTPPTMLRVIEEIPAGSVPNHEVIAGTCAKIMTGAPVPRGADSVVIVENTTPLADNRVQINSMVKLGKNIRKGGEEFNQGDLLLAPQKKITPGVVGLCTSVGISQVKVYDRPKVGIIATGDEVIPLGTPLKAGQIWSSNTMSLYTAIQQANGIPIDCGIAQDSVQSIREKFHNALSAKCDIIISTGGVSVGDFDLVKTAMADMGVDIHFWKVRMKPGKPLALGTIGNVPLFGLPGNPVSCLVGFYQFVRPLIRRTLGASYVDLPKQSAVLGHDIVKKHNRDEFFRVTLGMEKQQTTARITGNQSSAWISSMAYANGLLYVPAETKFLPKGTVVMVETLPE